MSTGGRASTTDGAGGSMAALAETIAENESLKNQLRAEQRGRAREVGLAELVLGR